VVQRKKDRSTSVSAKSKVSSKKRVKLSVTSSGSRSSSALIKLAESETNYKLRQLEQESLEEVV
jgi:hypothetical protein